MVGDSAKRRKFGVDAKWEAVDIDGEHFDLVHLNRPSAPSNTAPSEQATAPAPPVAPATPSVNLVSRLVNFFVSFKKVLLGRSRI